MRKKKPNWECAHCGKIHLPDRHVTTRKFCDLKCQGAFRTQQRINDWLENGVFSRCIKDYILEDQKYKCAVCGMKNEWNQKPIIFILDHIDGNSQDHSRNNLRCVCPNCDTQLDTYKNRNLGNGRHNRRLRYKNGKSY